MKTPMIYIKIFLLHVIGICFSLTWLLSATDSTPVNVLSPFDTLIRPDYSADYRFQLTSFAETGFHNAHGYDEDGDRVNPLQIWQPEQNALTMLKGFDSNSEIGKLLTQLRAPDDGTRGHFRVDGDLELDFAFALAARFFFKKTWSFSVYFPVYRYELKNVMFEDQTQNVTDEDRRVRQLLTNNFAENVKRLGNGLELQNWKRTGPGDLTLLLEWFRDFYQNKPFLKNARINWRAGVSIPSGFRRDEDKLFAIPFGNDGAFAIPFGVGLDLTLGTYFKLGLDVQLTHIFGSTRTRRIKTSEDQTELLLLKKVQTHKDFGLTQRFNLYFQFYKFLKGLSFKVGYQFKKHGDDELSLKTNVFSSEIANSAQSLEVTSNTMEYPLMPEALEYLYIKQQRYSLNG